MAKPPCRRPDHRPVKVHRSYLIEEAANVLHVHKNTVRAWIRTGLPLIDRTRPFLIRGEDLIAYLFEAGCTVRSRSVAFGRCWRRRTLATTPIATQLIGLHAITAIWGVHLTGVRDLPPRAARRRSLQAGRMSALSRRLGRNSLWALAHNKVLVTNRSMRDSKLQDPVEQHPSAT
jgi:hypothetical protein